MRHRSCKYLITAALLISLAFTLGGCGIKLPFLRSSGSFEGAWLDVNSDAKLYINGSKMTIDYGTYTEKYGIIIKKEGGTTYIKCKDDDGFGIMSSITVSSDGKTLTAEDMVLDAPGHHYRFVRKEDYESEFALQDLSKDAPKEIESTVIDSFSLYFTNNYGSYGISEDWPGGSVSWNINKRDGVYHMNLMIMGDSYVAYNYESEVSEEYVAGLEKLIRNEGIPGYNGYYMKNNVSYPGYGLFVNYESGEYISIRAEGEAAKEMVFDLPALMEYAALLADPNADCGE